MALQLVLALGILISLLPTLGNAAPRAKPTKLRTVGTDPAGDWGIEDASAASQATSATGADLTKAAIGTVDWGTLKFVISVADLPEVTRLGALPVGYAWNFKVDKNTEVFEISSCSTDFLVSACSEYLEDWPNVNGEMFVLMSFPTESSGSPNDGGWLPKLRGLLTAHFDPNADTITLEVPRGLLASSSDHSLPGPGSVIKGATEFGPSLRTFSAIPVWGPSDSPVHYIPNDDLNVTKRYVIRATGKRKAR